MAIVKFVTARCPMNNIFPYVMNPKKTDGGVLVSGIHCMPETALNEFQFVKNKFSKTDGRHYTEIAFPRLGVRYIAINDNYDSLYTEGNELAPFKNLFNEWYARDTSKKIRAVVKAKAERGERVST